MITSSYFEQYENLNEQNLLDDLIIESIKIYGIDTIYIARTLVNYDKLYTTDDQSLYEDNWPIEIYLKSFWGFQGDKDFMSKFAGTEIRDQIVFSLSRTRFDQDIANDLGSS